MYKFRHVIKLDEYSGATLEILVDANDHLNVRAIDLVGDAWYDLLEGLKRADEFENQNRIYDRNREIQTSLTKMMTHLDAVVSGMCKYLEHSQKDFHLPKRGKRDCSLAKKIEYLIDYSNESRGKCLPPLDLNFKVFRDLLIHPYVEKSVKDTDGNIKPINQSDLFDLSLNELKMAVSMLDKWLGDITALFQYPRGYDTERLAQDYSQKITKLYRKFGGELPPDDQIESSTYRI